MRIDRNIEKPTRDLLGHAIRGELDEMGRLIYAIGDDLYMQCSALCISIAGYVAIDVSGQRWPTDATLREISRHAAETTTEFDLHASDVFDFLSRVVLGSDKLDQVFKDHGVATTLPVVASARVLISFCPRDKEWWEYLEVIEEALEAAATLDLSVLPALMLRSRRPRVLDASGGVQP